MLTHEIELFQFLDTLEENFLNGKIPYERYAATIATYQPHEGEYETESEEN